MTKNYESAIQFSEIGTISSREKSRNEIKDLTKEFLEKGGVVEKVPIRIGSAESEIVKFSLKEHNNLSFQRAEQIKKEKEDGLFKDD